MSIHHVSFYLFVSFCFISCNPKLHSPELEKNKTPVSRSTRDFLENFNASWSQDPLWDDGQAEVSLYDATRPQYGRVEPYEAVLIVVKEIFNGRLLVKADAPYRDEQVFPVIKLNAIHSYWTERYPYHYLLSVFVHRDNPSSLVKLTLGGQEWCGNTFNEIKVFGSRQELISHSYFDGQGDKTQELNLRGNDFVEDQLPLLLRSLKFKTGLQLSVRILPSLVSNRPQNPPELVPTSITVDGEEEVETALGTRMAWKVSLQTPNLQQAWWFEKIIPHILLKMDSSDGRTWILKDQTRKAYWREPTFYPEM